MNIEVFQYINKMFLFLYKKGGRIYQVIERQVVSVCYFGKKRQVNPFYIVRDRQEKLTQTSVTLAFLFYFT